MSFPLVKPSRDAADKDQEQRHPYSFHIGASWSGKSDQDWSSHPDTAFGPWTDHMLNTSTRKVGMKCPGDDFFFIQQMRDQSGVSIGIADGVGSWITRGIDSSFFSQALMYYAHQSSCSAWAGEPEINPTMDREETEQIEGQEMTPYECLDLAYSNVLQDKDVECGSSTACILSLNSSSGLLRSANLGDSGYLIIRSNQVLYMSDPQTLYFNYTNQMAKLLQVHHDEGDYINDHPRTADTHEVQLDDGDIIVVFTDGLSDNVFPSEMIDTIRSSAAQAGDTEDQQVKNMADQLVDFATRCMHDWKKKTPWACGAEKCFSWRDADMKGGKPDDVTAIVCLVRKTS